MMTTVNYVDYPPEDFYLDHIGMTEYTYRQAKDAVRNESDPV